MKLYRKFNLNDSHEKVLLFVVLQFVNSLLCFFAEAIRDKSFFNLSFFFQGVLLLITFNFFYQTLRQLYYSFWNLSALVFFYYIFSIFRNYLILDSPLISLGYCASLLLLILSLYIISSPLYYPRVAWWEYDFRFRPDIRIWVETDGERFRGRLSDLRRNAGCIEIFHHFPVGQTFKVSTEIMGKSFNLFARVKSKKEPILGRTVIYGVKFLAHELEEKQRLKLLTNLWIETKKIKLRSKFQKVNES
jgi:hypothetical protein